VAGLTVVRPDEPSRTARGVAIARSLLQREPWETGDAAADDRLTRALAGEIDERTARAVRGSGTLFDWIRVRTAFMDRALVDALRAGIDQVVILGAGYDGRAVRYRTPGVQFFEVDHPATQADKRARYAEVGARIDDVAFVAADFTEPGWSDALAAGGHDVTRPTQYVCEGVLRYLPADALRSLLRAASDRAADRSRLATTFSTREGEPTGEERVREEALAAAGEAVHTVPPRAVALAWVAEAGWTVTDVDDPLDVPAGPSGRGRMLLAAVRDPARATAAPIP
jgi:methyltransferase (TIGR00027 family)